MLWRPASRGDPTPPMLRVRSTLATLLPLAALACAVHHPNLEPNPARAERERNQLDAAVASQPLLREPDNWAARRACIEQVEARALKDPSGLATAGALDRAVNDCLAAKQTN